MLDNSFQTSSSALRCLSFARNVGYQRSEELQVHPHGSTDSLPFCTMGSGSLAAMAVFEAGFKEELSREDAVALVARAIRSGPPCAPARSHSQPMLVKPHL